ncbi:hypothetical protein FBU59_005770, partial [Linderina macrospora]
MVGLFASLLARDRVELMLLLNSCALGSSKIGMESPLGILAPALGELLPWPSDDWRGEGCAALVASSTSSTVSLNCDHSGRCVKYTIRGDHRTLTMLG